MLTDGHWWVTPRGSSGILLGILRGKRDRNLAQLVALLRLCRDSAPREFAEARAAEAFEMLKSLPPAAVGKALPGQPTFGCWLAMVECALSAHLGQHQYQGHFASSLPGERPPLVVLLTELWRYAAGAAAAASREVPPFRLWFTGDVALPGTQRWLRAVPAGTEIDLNRVGPSLEQTVTAGDQGCRLELDRADVFLRLWAQDESFPGDRQGALAEAEALSAFAARLSGAVALLRTTRPMLVEEIAIVMQSVVPLLSLDPEINLSVSAPEFFGTTMITYDSTPMLAEGLAHEYRHNLLNAVTEISALVTPEAEGRIVYSPWRDDPRPLMGLFHALFTFTEVAEFLRAAVRSGDLSAVNTRAAARRCLAHVARLEIGVEEIKDTPGVTEFGFQMVAGFKDALLGLRADLPTLASLGGTDATEVVYNHERLYRRRGTLAAAATP